ncbi:MAG: phosphate ABC transporter permease subunit PstC [Actinomycetota bacterium]|nr:phosphate ABC transporter permease subunit PstC [Actinomycetota bacterium]
MNAVPSAEPFRARRRIGDRFGDLFLHGLTGAAAALALVVLGLIAWKLFDGASLAFSKFGLDFVTGTVWDTNRQLFGAGNFLYGTAVTAFGTLLLATPISLAIALYLSELAPGGVRGAVGALVELLAAVPSVVLGLWGILVMGPFVARHVEPTLHSALGFIPLFNGPYSPVGFLPAILILTIMVVPITTSICRELFLSVPTELEEGALALGSTRWEMVRGVVFPYTRSGIAAAVILGLGRAIGEAIAVAQVIGGFGRITAHLFDNGDTLAAKIALSYIGAETKLQLSSIIYLAAILLVIALIVNGAAQLIVNRFEHQRTGGS